MLTETVTMHDGAEYTLKTRLSWFDTQTIQDTGAVLIFELDGKTFQNVQDLERVMGAREDAGEVDGVLRCEMKTQTAQQNLVRLKARLVNMSPRQIMQIPNPHAAQLLARIAELEAEEQQELNDLLPGNPTTPRLSL